MPNTFEKVKSIISDRLEISGENITLEAKFIDDLGADSLDTYELLQGLEEEFKISIPEDEAQGFETVGQVVKYIDKTTT